MNFKIVRKAKEAIFNKEVDGEQSDDSWPDDEFSDIESDSESEVATSKDEHIYNDISAIDCSNDADGVREDVYENYDSEVTKTNEMRKAPPVLPPRKTDNIPKPPARRKKEKKPPLPEKIHSDQEDNQFYEEMNQMTLNSSSSLPSPPKSVPPLPKKDQQNKTNSHEIEDDGNYLLPVFQRQSPGQVKECRSFPPLRVPARKMPAIPSMTSNDKTSSSHRSPLFRPRIEPPKEKPTENPLNVFPWYHGASERMVVENKLLHYKMDGMYAVRNSTTKGPSYPYAVTLYHSGKTYNFPIRIRDSDKRLALGIEKKNEPNFETLDALINYFNKNKIQLMNNQFVLLSIPLDQSS